MANGQSSIHLAPKLLSIPLFLPAFLVILLAMLAEAMSFSYIALLAVDTIGMSPLELGTFLILSALSGMIASTVLGHLYDLKPVVWPVLLSLLAKALGFGLCTVLKEPWMLLLNSATLLGISAASFPLLFAIAKSYLNGTDHRVIASGMAALRMATSLSWTVGPALAAAAVGWWNIGAVYLAAAALATLALALFLLAGLTATSRASSQKQRITRGMLVAAAPILVALTAYHTAMFAGSSAMSVLVAQEYGSSYDVGMMFSLCALLEVAAMSIFVLRPAAGVSRFLLLVGFVIFAAYFALPIIWPSLSAFYVGQLLRAVGIAIVSIVGMAYLQELLPDRAGTVAALFGNTSSVGLLLSGVATGFWAGHFGYLSLFGACGVLCVAGSVPLYLWRQRAPEEQH